MALINCPECGKENVSDSAPTCPSCGYAINEHFEKIKKDEWTKAFKIKTEEENKQAEQRRSDSVQMPEKPKYSTPAAICGVLCFILGCSSVATSDEYEIAKSVADGNGNPVVIGWCLIIGGIIILCIAFSDFMKKLNNYKFAQNNFEQYKKEKILADDQFRKQALKNANATPTIHCPTCGSTNVSKIGTGKKVASGVAFGIFAAGTISKTFQCGKCGYKW